MEFRTASPEELKAAYTRDLKQSFPPDELKPLWSITSMCRRGLYAPLCLLDGGEIVGECFLWMSEPGDKPGYALLDYLCVTPEKRSQGLGGVLIARMLERYPDTVIFAESETPAFAPDPELAARRMNFYTRNGARQANYQTDIFGVHYSTVYWSDVPVPDAELIAAHRAVYATSLPADKFERYVRIPCIT